MDHHLRAAGVGNVIVEKVEAQILRHRKDRADLDLDVLGKDLDLGPGAPRRVGLDADVRQVRHEQVGEVDQHQPAVLLLALDRQGLEDAVGIRNLHRIGLGRTGLGANVDVAADHQQAIGRPMKTDQPLVAEIQRVAAQIHHARAAGDRDRQDHLLVVLGLLDLHEELLFLLVVVQAGTDLPCAGALDYLVPFGQRLSASAPGALTTGCGSSLDFAAGSSAATQQLQTSPANTASKLQTRALHNRWNRMTTPPL